jgi:predicted kinase
VGTIVLTCGMPGAGKTVLARRLEAERDAVRLTPDEWMLAVGLDPHDPRAKRDLERVMWRHALRLAGLGLTVVVDFGLWTRPERTKRRDEARAAGHAVELHALDVPLAVRWERVERRNAEPDAVVISRAELEEYERWWQVPDDAELAGYDGGSTTVSGGPAPR